jgi:hypothetical protein
MYARTSGDVSTCCRSTRRRCSWLGAQVGALFAGGIQRICERMEGGGAEEYALLRMDIDCQALGLRETKFDFSLSFATGTKTQTPEGIIDDSDANYNVFYQHLSRCVKGGP